MGTRHFSTILQGSRSEFPFLWHRLGIKLASAKPALMQPQAFDRVPLSSTGRAGRLELRESQWSCAATSAELCFAILWSFVVSSRQSEGRCWKAEKTIPRECLSSTLGGDSLGSSIGSFLRATSMARHLTLEAGRRVD